MTRPPPESDRLLRKVLGDTYVELELGRLTLDEEPERSAVVKVTVIERGSKIEVEGRGVGMVDALYSGLLGRYALEYQSLRTVKLASFDLAAEVETKQGGAGVDAVGTVTIDVLNSEGRRFSFSDSSRSMTASAARAVLGVVQYFVNAERAFLTLYRARRDALERGRDDLVVRYTAEMAEVVESTSYADVIDAIRKELGG
ncbi:MAG: alpha-isopropylmalate synthase regulatory domain-containing protein [Kofleriaceae bacterium]